MLLLVGECWITSLCKVGSSQRAVRWDWALALLSGWEVRDGGKWKALRQEENDQALSL